MTEVNTIEEMKALLDSINVKYRSNATESSLKHLISKHKALIPSDDKVAENETESDLEVSSNTVSPQGENTFTEVDVSVDQPITESNQPEFAVIKPAQVPDVNVPLEAPNPPEPVVESENENIVVVAGDPQPDDSLLEKFISGDVASAVIPSVTISNEDFDRFVEACGGIDQGVNVATEDDKLLAMHNALSLEDMSNKLQLSSVYGQFGGSATETNVSENFLLGKVDMNELPRQLVIKKNVLKTFIDELYAAARLGYVVSDEKKSINILDLPYKVKLSLPEDAIQSVSELVPHMKIKVKTYKYKDFIQEFMQFAYAGAKVGKVNSFIISSGQYVFEVYVDENYVLRKNKDYYAGKI